MRRNILNFNFLQQLIFPVSRKKSPVDFGSQRERKHHLWVSDDVYSLTSTISSCVPPTTTWSTTYGSIYKARLTTCLIRAPQAWNTSWAFSFFTYRVNVVQSMITSTPINAHEIVTFLGQVMMLPLGPYNWIIFENRWLSYLKLTELDLLTYLWGQVTDLPLRRGKRSKYWPSPETCEFFHCCSRLVWSAGRNLIFCLLCTYIRGQTRLENTGSILQTLI